MALLEVKNLGINFGGLRAVDGVNLTIEEGELYGLIGPNGAGKTTVFNLLTGVYKPTSGTIRLDNENIVGKSPSQICQTGIARTFQNIRLFNNMTVLENVKAAFHNQVKYSLLASFLHSISFFSGEKEMGSRALELLKVFGLDTFANDYARNLSYGAQRKLEIARALATNPKLLLLDEPAAGMNPQETSELMDTIKLIRERFHVTILLIEHDMKLVSGICENILVLNFGTELANGTPDEVLNNPEVITAYLGEE
ncbi:MAG: ABC transporter ATP-binding protein [Clostridiales bacterium]|nr:ABC transporter ATP-binding protein [Clostridiales bacterium]